MNTSQQTAIARDGTFYGWWIVACSFLVLFVTVGVGLYAPPVFLVPLQEHFGWSRAAIAAGSAVAAVVSGLTSPLVGMWIDKYGSRTVMTGGALLMGGAFALFGLIGSIWQLYVLNALAAVGITCVAWIPNQALIANWFTKKRGLAMGIALTGIGFGGLVMAPLAALLIARLGWRVAFGTLGGLILVVVVTVVLAVVRSRPADMGVLPDGDTDASAASDGATGGSAGVELGQALRTSVFWTLALAHFLWTFASLSIIGHFVAHLRDAGFEGGTAAAALGITIGASVAGRVIVGYVADSAGKRGILTAALLLSGLGTAILLRIESTAALPLFVVTYGMGLGGIAVLFPLLVGECFGLLAFGKILGLIMIAATLGGAAGPVLTGRIYDVSGNYQLAFMLHVAVFLAAAVAVYLLPHPAQIARAAAERVPG
ncbi:MAG: MFS transporter [Deltaproteobacteria bacterium]|nr:MFS transporter [Deltaproteobacteria bacterium]